MISERAKEAERPMIFGTDGVRDRAGEGFLSPSSVERIVAGAAMALEECSRFKGDFPRPIGKTIVVARDTRASGPALLKLVSRGFATFGYTVADIGVLPTPGAAFIASAWKECALGVVLSASHNPAEYNGIKFLAPTGAKISPEFEKAVSHFYWLNAAPRRSEAQPGPVDRSAEAIEAYVRRLVVACRKPERLVGKRIAVDAANGAAFQVAPEVFQRLGMQVDRLGTEPDGQNINLGCGTLHPESLGRLVQDRGASLGFCFDGDADRMIPVTGRGAVLDGDHVLCLAGRSFLKCGRLPRKTIVATSMSNIGLELALKESGISLLRTDVGDRNVYLAMLEGGHPVGGEQSGHIIFLEDAMTGDGILAALRLLDVMEADDLDLDAESRVMKRYPQLLKNVRVKEKIPLESLSEVQAAVAAATARLDGQGRIVLRYSGTEPLARVMLEGPDAETVETLTNSICEAIQRSLPSAR